MPSFLTDSEKVWYDQLGNSRIADEMRQCLKLLKAGVAELWNAGKVIQNFTDHGIPHNERIIDKLWEVYQQRTSYFRTLSPEETFVLLATVYLHDVGMQCTDANLFSKVGAKVVNRLPANYTIEEQTEIRKHHSELSAEMIGWAFRVKLSGPLPKYVAAIKTIPSDYITPIMDVVRYHSDDIDGCPPTFLGVGRRQLLALLLRLADELDICRDRVNINEVKLYPKPLPSEYWWWIHYYTTLIEIRQNLIVFHLRLNPSDAKEYGLRLEKVIVDKFVQKNKELLSRLSRDGIPLAFIDKAEIEHDPVLPPLPKGVVQVIDEILYENLREAFESQEKYSKNLLWLIVNYDQLRRNYLNMYVAVWDRKVICANKGLKQLFRELKVRHPGTNNIVIGFVSDRHFKL